MASSEKPDELPPSKKWECGDPYRYKIPKDGDPWENLLANRMESDKAQCESWKDEVQNLLIFAGLFSGVLTAFVIESYQGLQPDQNDIMIALLTRIATRLDNPLNGTSLVSQQIDAVPSTSPLPSSIRINIFWFISLVFSLTTVLIGIVSLQWLREHQEYPQSLSSRDRFALFNMRVRGLEAWHVPEIFAALPVLLQFALVLFFVGLVDFLLASQTKVAIPVIVAIGVPIVFVVWTTVAPSLQAFMLCLPIAGRGGRVPEQCPYKSTQSRILRHIITFSSSVFKFVAHSIVVFHSFVILPSLRLFNASMKGQPTTGEYELSIYEFERRYLFEAILDAWYEKKWLKFDQAWLTLRDAYAKSLSDGEWWISHSSRHRSKLVGALYDLSNGICDVVVRTIDPTIQSSAFHCVQDLTSSIIGENSQLDYGNAEHNQWLQKLLGNPQSLTEPFPTFSSILEEPTHDFLRDENSFIFLSQCIKPPLTSLQHFVELHIRIFNYIYPTQPLAFSSDAFPSYPDGVFLFNYGKKTMNRDSAFDVHISAQFSLAVESFVKSVSNHDITDETLLASFHGKGLGEFLRYAALRQSEDAIQSTIDFLAAALIRYTTGDGKFGQRSDFIFYVSAFYARSLMILDSWGFFFWNESKEWDDNAIVEAFLPVLRHYLQERGTPDVALGEKLGIPALSDDSWWGFFNRNVEKVQDSSQEMSDKLDQDLKSEPEANSGLVMGPDADNRV